jgi:TolA-binding protein
MLQLDLNRTSEAKATLTRVVNTYPNSSVAALAQEELRKIGG